MASVVRPPTRIAAFALIAATCFLLGVRAMAADGLITIKSAFGPEETMKRLEAEVKARGLTVFARVDHAAGAAAVYLPLRPTDLLIFGNAKGGTPLMQSVQTIGIDLPLKALVWQDESGTTWLSYNDPAFLAHRHGLGEQAKAAGTAITAALNAIAPRQPRRLENNDASNEKSNAAMRCFRDPKLQRPRRRLCRPDPQGRKAGRPAGRAADQIRACHQSQDGQDWRCDQRSPAPTR